MNPRTIEELGNAMGEVYEAVVNRILINLAHHFPMIAEGTKDIEGAWSYQVTKLAEMGQVNRETEQIILSMLKNADEALQTVLENAIIDGLKDAEKPLRDAAEKGLINGGVVPPMLAPNQMQAFQSYYRQSADKLNLVNTVMLESTRQAYQATVSDIVAKMEKTQSILNVATGEVVTGVTAMNSAVRSAVKKMVENGITGYIDHAGRRWSPEGYVTMDIRTTVANAARDAVTERMNQYGSDLYQVSYHDGARPLCYPWQGKVISRTGQSGETEDGQGNKVRVYAESETSKGEPAGLFGINCGHYPIPFFPGYSRIRPPAQNEEENAKEYELSQKQRALERKLRNEKRDLAVLKAQGASEEEIAAQRERVRAADTKLDDFSSATGRARRKSREYVPIKPTFPDKDTYDPKLFDSSEKREINQFYRGGGTSAVPGSPVVPEAKRTLKDSLADAYEYHRTKNNLTSVPYDPDAKLQFIKTDLTNIGADSKDTIEETLGELLRKYDTPLTTVETMDKKWALIRKDAFAYVSHEYSTDTAKMVINPLKCADKAKMVERLTVLRNKGYCASVPDEMLDKYVFTHEFGHSLLHMKINLPAKENYVNVDVKRLNSIGKEVLEIFERYKSEVGSLVQAQRAAEMRVITTADPVAAEEARRLAQELKTVKISEYSLTDADEFFAESFVYTEYGGTGNKYADAVREIINRYFLR